MKQFKKIIAIVFISALAACSKSGEEYLGKWVNTKNDKATMEIVRNGDNYLITEKIPALYGNPPTTSTAPATLKDGMLQVQTGLGAVPVSYVKASDTLTVSGIMGNSNQYRRIN